MNVRVLSVIGVLFASTSFAAGQTTQPMIEIIGSGGVARIMRIEDRGFGTKANAGAGVDVRIWRGLRAGAEVNWTFGLSPAPVACGSIYPGPGLPAYPCIGSARAGVGAATAASFTAGWLFGTGRIQPFVLGGLSVLKTKEFTSVSIVHADYVELQERSSSDTGLGMTIGFGLRASVGKRFSIRPELRFADGTAMSAHNMSQLRFSVGFGYGW